MGWGSGAWWGVVFQCKIKAKGKGVGRVGGGVGTDKGTGKPMRTRLSKLPFSGLPFGLSRFNNALHRHYCKHVPAE